MKTTVTVKKPDFANGRISIEGDLLLPVGDLEMRQLYEHMRRQAIEDLRFYDLMLYGDKGHTIPERRR